jgi:G3E family GTPase
LNSNTGNGQSAHAPVMRRRRVRHAHQSYQTCGFQFTRAADRHPLQRFLERLDPSQVVRAKGFVRLRGFPRQWFTFHYVLGRHALEPYRGAETPNPVSVFIGPQVDTDRLQRRLDRVFPPVRRKLRKSAASRSC